MCLAKHTHIFPTDWALGKRIRLVVQHAPFIHCFSRHISYFPTDWALGKGIRLVVQHAPFFQCFSRYISYFAPPEPLSGTKIPRHARCLDKGSLLAQSEPAACKRNIHISFPQTGGRVILYVRTAVSAPWRSTVVTARSFRSMAIISASGMFLYIPWSLLHSLPIDAITLLCFQYHLWHVLLHMVCILLFCFELLGVSSSIQKTQCKWYDGHHFSKLHVSLTRYIACTLYCTYRHTLQLLYQFFHNMVRIDVLLLIFVAMYSSANTMLHATCSVLVCNSGLLLYSGI